MLPWTGYQGPMPKLLKGCLGFFYLLRFCRKNSPTRTGSFNLSMKIGRPQASNAEALSPTPEAILSTAKEIYNIKP